MDDLELALASKLGYQLLHPDLDPDRQGDLNGDGVLDAFDVGPFEALLAGGPGSAPGSAPGRAPGSVPEPGSLGLLALGLAGSRRGRGRRA